MLLIILIYRSCYLLFCYSLTLCSSEAFFSIKRVQQSVVMVGRCHTISIFPTQNIGNMNNNILQYSSLSALWPTYIMHYHPQTVQ